MLNTNLVVAALAFALAGCAGGDEVGLLAGSGQRAASWDGPSPLISAKRHVVMLQTGDARGDFEGRPTFVVAVRNMQSWKLLFKVTNIHATQVMANGTTSTLEVWGRQELAGREQRRRKLETYGARLERPLNSMSAPGGDSAESFDSKGSAGRPAHTDQAYDAYQGYTPRQLAGAQTSADFATIRAQGQANLAASQGKIIGDHTLLPGEWYGGTFVLDVSSKAGADRASYVVAIDVDIETHEFHVGRETLARQ